MRRARSCSTGTTGPSIAVKAQKKQGAPTAIDLATLLGEPAEKRDKWIADRADRKLTDTVKKGVKDAKTLDDLHAALAPVVDRYATPDLVPAGSMVLQPSEERRRSGSHYTPRSLTEPIVRTTLEPILKRLRGENDRPPKPEQILDLKVCDPAMGSGAFLVEACRQLGDALVESWRAHDAMPQIPFDENEEIFARRLVAQRCLYGVDKNPVAVDLAKVSLWLFTLAREHPLTFIDHALRHGDSLVGLSRKQIEAFQWDESAPAFQQGFEVMRVREHLERVTVLRRRILEAGDDVTDRELRELWHEAQVESRHVSLFGDLLLAAFFEAETARERESKRNEYAKAVADGWAEHHRERLEEWRNAERPFVPFHWMIEFPEVFERENMGFDAIVGNPPFLGGTSISERLGMAYFQWLTSSFHSCRHHCDLVAYFFRRTHAILREGGCFGLIATNTIAQGDTREGGLRVLLLEGADIYKATRRLKWPGMAAVVVSVIHATKGRTPYATLDEVSVSRVSAYLVDGAVDDSPSKLLQNPYFSLGCKIYGQGFLFADNDPECTPITVRERMLEAHPEWESRIPPYLGGEEVNSDPLHSPNRFAITFSDIQAESDLDQWPALKAVVEEKVKPERFGLGSNPNNAPLKRRWWAYQAHRPELYAAIAGLDRVLVIARVGLHGLFTFLPVPMVYSEQLVVFPLSTYAAFCALQSRSHEIWARFFGSSLEDRLRYTPSDCFETFPFPVSWQTHPPLEAAGKEYYEFRAALMIRNDEGLTKTYNRFHDPEERDPDILRLRELHAAMDRAVLDAYGWSDISTDCDFFLDYEIDEEEWGTKKKPYRYRWPDEVRDEVLARLLELNAQRAAEEARAGAAGTNKRGRKAARKHAPTTDGTGDLFS